MESIRRFGMAMVVLYFIPRAFSFHDSHSAISLDRLSLIPKRTLLQSSWSWLIALLETALSGLYENCITRLGFQKATMPCSVSRRRSSTLCRLCSTFTILLLFPYNCYYLICPRRTPLTQAQGLSSMVHFWDLFSVRPSISSLTSQLTRNPARLEYLSFWGVFCLPGKPGSALSECYWDTKFDRNRIGIQMHLSAILPAALLAVIQFIPIVRYKALLYHRMAGYVAILLVLVSHAGALMIAQYTFGGDYATQCLIGVLAIISIGSLAFAVYNIKMLQIEQHRAWMLRAWAYMASIITLRIIQAIAFSIEAAWPDSQRYGATSCDELLFYYQGNSTKLSSQFPACDPSNARFATDGWVAVKGDFNGNVANIMQALSQNFGMAGWLALAIHAALVEVYLKMTPRETERLRRVSYEKQLERGMKMPGSAGLVVERFGDSEPWAVPEERNGAKKGSSTAGLRMGGDESD